MTVAEPPEENDTVPVCLPQQNPDARDTRTPPLWPASRWPEPPALTGPDVPVTCQFT